MVQMDILQYPQHTPGGNSFVRVWGISYVTAQQAGSLNGKDITVRGGMGKGLPLANPSQAGVLVKGAVFQAFANWQGVNMTLDIYLITGAVTDDQTQAAADNLPAPPANISFDWKAGTQIGPAIKTTLSSAYPKYTVNVNVSPKLVTADDQPGWYPSLTTFAQWIKPYTQSLLGGNYSGVAIKVKEKVIDVSDSGSQAAPAATGAKVINFTDLVGQVTWVEPMTVNVPMVMRGDLDILQRIMLPQGQVTTSPTSLSQYRDKFAINGPFKIQQIRHVGDSRLPDASGWTTDIWAFQDPPVG